MIYNGVLYNSSSEYSIPPGLGIGAGSSGDGGGGSSGGTQKENTTSEDAGAEGGGSAVTLGARRASLLALALALAICVGNH